jgi:hypothetical protein
MQLQVIDEERTIRQNNSTRTWESPLDRRWAQTRDRFLAAVDPKQRATVAGLLRQRHRGGLGLRMWLRTLVTQDRPLPESLPTELVQVYLDDPEAVPLYDCASCGLAVPVLPGWRGYEGEPERVYFLECPCCGGSTGLHAYWSNTIKR